MYKKRKLKKWVKRLITALIAAYLITGCCAAAIDSHRDPEKHKTCIINEIC